ncbi:hypothetical protein JM16_008112, partial [Phytophthora kernoviae]
MSRIVCLVVAFATLLVLTVHAAETKRGISLCTFDDDDEQQQQQQEVQQSPPDPTEEATAYMTNWPPLRLDFTVKHNSAKVFGHSNFSILANPIKAVHAANVLYDAFATFTEGSTLHEYTLVNGTAYLSSSSMDDSSASSTVKCLGWGNMEVLSLVNSLVGILNEAKPSLDSERSAKCATGKMFTAVITGSEFTVCASNSSGFTVHGSTMDIDVQYLEGRADILPPKVDAEEKNGCVK